MHWSSALSSPGYPWPCCFLPLAVITFVFVFNTGTCTICYTHPSNEPGLAVSCHANTNRRVALIGAPARACRVSFPSPMRHVTQLWGDIVEAARRDGRSVGIGIEVRVPVGSRPPYDLPTIVCWIV